MQLFNLMRKEIINLTHIKYAYLRLNKYINHLLLEINTSTLDINSIKLFISLLLFYSYLLLVSLILI